MKSEIEVLAAEWFARRDAGLNSCEEAAFQEWLGQDPRHREEFSKLQSTWTTYGGAVRVGATEALMEELTQLQMRRKRRRSVATAVAAALMVLGVGFWQRSRFEPAAIPGAGTIVHRVEERLLDDGSKIILRKGAQVDVLYAEHERHVALRNGEALFEVAKDSVRPFVVRVSGVDVKAVGTAFSISKDGRTVDVLVTEGTISVSPSLNVNHGADSSFGPNGIDRVDVKPILVAAGNRILVEDSMKTESSLREEVSRAEMERRLGWKAPRVEFNGTLLQDAVALLNREAEGRTNVRLNVVDRELNAIRVSGTFRIDNLEGFVSLLKVGFGIKIEQEGEVLFLRKKGS